MHNEYFHISNEFGIAHLQLNRPDRLNTMGPALMRRRAAPKIAT
ncbi:hypothetical protein [Paraburkholderia terrae]|nr:hypothetical protein [Paraburkholderia terrae]